MFFLSALIGFTVKFSKKDDRPKVVVVVKTLDREYWGILELGAKKAFDDFDIDGKVIAPDSEYPITKQTNMLENVLKQNPDGLIVALTHPASTIPVLLADTDAKWKDTTSYIGTDNYTLGQKAGELLGSMLQPGDQVALISGTLDNPVINDRNRGSKKGFRRCRN